MNTNANYKNYIININEYNNIDLYKNGGIIKVNIGDQSYIMIGKKILTDVTTFIIKLQNQQGLNKKILKCYNLNKNVNIEILEITNENKDILKQKKMYYINKFKSKLNYHLNNGFSEEHKQHMSESKIGEKHNRSKLTEKEAIQIKKLMLSGIMTSEEIGQLFNISAPQVRKIKQGRAWAHINV